MAEGKGFKIIFCLLVLAYMVYCAFSVLKPTPYVSPSSTTRLRAENGDRYGVDNDGDGRIEEEFVRGYYKSDGTYVRSHYRAK